MTKAQKARLDEIEMVMMKEIKNCTEDTAAEERVEQYQSNFLYSPSGPNGHKVLYWKHSPFGLNYKSKGYITAKEHKAKFGYYPA